jgi:hypothetical protein
MVPQSYIVSRGSTASTYQSKYLLLPAFRFLFQDAIMEETQGFLTYPFRKKSPMTPIVPHCLKAPVRD